MWIEELRLELRVWVRRYVSILVFIAGSSSLCLGRHGQRWCLAAFAAWYLFELQGPSAFAGNKDDRDREDRDREHERKEKKDGNENNERTYFLKKIFLQLYSLAGCCGFSFDLCFYPAWGQPVDLDCFHQQVSWGPRFWLLQTFTWFWCLIEVLSLYILNITQQTGLPPSQWVLLMLYNYIDIPQASTLVLGL